MELKVIREPHGAATPGKLLVNGSFFCYTLEDQDRGLTQSMPLSEIQRLKVHSQTAIPKGKYTVVISYSNRFGRMLPLLSNVPGFEGIRIHPGNFISNTEGCLLVGTGRSGDTITNSRAAFDALFPQLEAASKREKITIEIV